jgi:hypothetical protein
VTHTVKKVAVKPKLLAALSKENGIEVGFQGSVNWESSIAINGGVTGQFFKSQDVKTPRVFINVPNPAGVPIPVFFQGAGSFTCSASASASVNITVDVKASASVAASVIVNAHASTAPSSWISQGRWAPSATGSASVTKRSGTNTTVQIACSVPRIEFSAMVFGVIGPYMTVSPTAVLDKSGLSMETRIAAGVKAAFMKASVSAEMPIKTFKHTK